MISFEHCGTQIMNPFLSSCGRFAVDPVEEYGFVVCECLLVKILDNGCKISLSGPSGYNLPTDPSRAIIGFSDSNGRLVVSYTVPSEGQIEDIQNARYVAVWGASFKKPGKKEVDISFFSASNGYEMDETVAIARLLLGKVWVSPNHSDHAVVRYQ